MGCRVLLAGGGLPWAAAQGATSLLASPEYLALPHTSPPPRMEAAPAVKEPSQKRRGKAAMLALNMDNEDILSWGRLHELPSQEQRMVGRRFDGLNLVADSVTCPEPGSALAGPSS